VAICVFVAGLVVWSVIGAWRMMTRDARGRFAVDLRELVLDRPRITTPVEVGVNDVLRQVRSPSRALLASQHAKLEPIVPSSASNPRS
jgi:hypothetical protein